MSRQFPEEPKKEVAHASKSDCRFSETSIPSRTSDGVERLRTATLTMTQPTLPLELVELLLSHALDDGSTLKRCTLVCRSWLPDARRALFRNLKFDERTDYRQILDIMKNSPGIRSCVKHLSLKICKDHLWSREKDLCTFLLDYAPDSLESLEVAKETDHRTADDDLLRAFYTYPARLPDLKSFTIYVSLLEALETYELEWLGRALSNLQSSIEEIRIEITADMAPDPRIIWQWERINWGDIDRIIDPARLPCLKRVTVVIEIQFDSDVLQETENWCRERVAKLNLVKHGIMEISFLNKSRKPTTCPQPKCWSNCTVQ